MASLRGNSLSLERRERLLGMTNGEYDYTKLRRGLVKLFPDRIIITKKRCEPSGGDRKFQPRKLQPRVRGGFSRGGRRGRFCYECLEANAGDS